MKILVAGIKGQLGYDVMNELASREIEGIGVSVEEMGITDKKVREIMIPGVRPNAVIHCAAYTAVDAAEGNLELCRRANTEGTRNITKICKALDTKIMYIGTDYVFSGGGRHPWEPNDHRRSLNVYGLTKYEGEISVRQNISKYFIVRIARVFGANGKNFIKTMPCPGKGKGTISVVDDQVGSPTYIYDLVRLPAGMMQTDRYGHYRATSEGMCSWYEFACEIFRQAGMNRAKVTPVDSSRFPAKAKRSQGSRTSRRELTENGLNRPPAWQDAPGRYLETLKENGTM